MSDDRSETEYELSSGRKLRVRTIAGELADIYVVRPSLDNGDVYFTIADAQQIHEALTQYFIGDVVLHHVAEHKDYTFEEAFSRVAALAGPAYRQLDRIAETALKTTPNALLEIRQSFANARLFLSELTAKIRSR